MLREVLWAKAAIVSAGFGVATVGKLPEPTIHKCLQSMPPPSSPSSRMQGAALCAQPAVGGDQKRRDFVGKLGLGSAALMTPALGGASGPKAQEQQRREEEQEHGNHDDQEPLEGSEANAVVNFGQWKTEPPMDRYPNVLPLPAQNNHQLLPFRVTIKKGGSVSFIISGLHQIIVYGPGTEPGDINTTLPTGAATTGMPLGVPLVNDPNNRIYRGPDPSLVGTFDRVESVHFPAKGTYLVICGVRGHFLEGMFGYVVVKR